MHSRSVRDDRRGARQLPPSLEGVTGGRLEHPAYGVGAAVAQHAARPDEQVDLSQVLAAALHDPALGAHHDLAASGMALERDPHRGGGDLEVCLPLVVGVGEEVRPLPASYGVRVEVVAPGGLDRRHRRPPHARRMGPH